MPLPLISIGSQTIARRSARSTFILLISIASLTATNANRMNSQILSAVATVCAKNSEMEEYVRSLKRTILPPDPAYAESQRLYSLACNRHNELVREWLQTLKTRQKPTPHLAAQAAQAERAAGEFIEYAANVTLGRRRTIRGLTHPTEALMAAASSSRGDSALRPGAMRALAFDLLLPSWPDIH